MKKAKFNLNQVTAFHQYLNECSPERLNIDSKIFAGLIQENREIMQKHLQCKALELMHKSKQLVTCKFTRQEVLTLSYLFGQLPCNSYLKTVEYELLRGIYI